MTRTEKLGRGRGDPGREMYLGFVDVDPAREQELANLAGKSMRRFFLVKKFGAIRRRKRRGIQNVGNVLDVAAQRAVDQCEFLGVDATYRGIRTGHYDHLLSATSIAERRTADKEEEENEIDNQQVGFGIDAKLLHCHDFAAVGE